MKSSVIIPTLNQEKKLSRCLEHLSNLEYRQDDFEVLVIDNGSTDNTKSVTLGFKKRINNLNYHYCAEPGLMAARHMGANNALGDIICFLDDDSMVNKNWMSAIEESYQKYDVVMVGGPCIPKYDINPPNWIEYFWEETPYGQCHIYLSLIDFGKEIKEIDPYYIFGCNFSIRKNIFFKYGGTLPDYYTKEYKQYMGSGETGLAHKISNAGLKSLYHPDARIDHLIANNRLEVEYFSFKMFFIGQTASYHDLRKNNGLDGFIALSPTKKMIKKIRRPFGKIKRDLKKQLIPAVKSDEPKKIIEMRLQMAQSFTDGYQYHQRMLKEDPKLIEWVLRKDYLGHNANLPFQD